MNFHGRVFRVPLILDWGSTFRLDLSAHRTSTLVAKPGRAGQAVAARSAEILSQVYSSGK